MKTYYKSNDPGVMAALAHHEAAAREIRAEGKLLADHFGGTLLVHNSVHGYSVAGLRFDECKPIRFWTVPADNGMQRPRQSIAKATAEEKAELIRLKAEWKNLFPRRESDFAPVMTAMGTDWGHCAFNGGFGMFQHDGYVYVVTGAKLADCMTEIMGSEYSAAKAAHDKEVEAAK